MVDQLVDDHIMDLMEDTTSSFCGNYNLGEFPPLSLLVCLSFVEYGNDLSWRWWRVKSMMKLRGLGLWSSSFFLP